MNNPHALILLACLALVGCRHDGQRGGAIGGSDTTTAILVADTARNAASDGDTLLYELPEFCLLRTDTLPPPTGTTVTMRTERPTYWPDVRALNVVVENPTDTPVGFGRSWGIEVWDGRQWHSPEWRDTTPLVWRDDLLVPQEAPARFCFRFPVGEVFKLPAGRYRILKTFRLGDRRLDLTAEFLIE